MRERPIESLDDAMADGADPRPQGPRRPHAWGLAVQIPRYPRRLRSNQTAIASFLVLGCVFRIIRYAQNLPLWSDECFLSVNFIDRGYRELLEPLDNGQIAPPLFLWAQRFIIDLGGFSEWSLRVLSTRLRAGERVSLLPPGKASFRVRFDPPLAGGWDIRGKRASDSPCIRGQALRL